MWVETLFSFVVLGAVPWRTRSVPRGDGPRSRRGCPCWRARRARRSAMTGTCCATRSESPTSSSCSTPRAPCTGRRSCTQAQIDARRVQPSSARPATASPRCRATTRARSSSRPRRRSTRCSKQTSDIQFGFATYNQDDLHLRAKHWLYRAAGDGPDIPGWGAFPAAGSDDVFGRAWSCDTGNGDNNDRLLPELPGRPRRRLGERPHAALRQGPPGVRRRPPSSSATMTKSTGCSTTPRAARWAWTSWSA